MKTGNKKKSQKKIQIKGKMPLSVHFFRDAEADALNVERCQLDKATLIACAVKRLREDLGNVPDSGKKPFRMTQEIYWELLAWLFRSFLAVTTFAFVVAGYQALRCRPRDGSKRRK